MNQDSTEKPLTHRITGESTSAAYSPQHNLACGRGGTLACDDDYQIIGIRSSGGHIWPVSDQPTCPGCKKP